MNGSRDVPQPIPYQGSKRQLAPVILPYFPHKVHRLVEPFAGSAAMSIAASSRGMAGSFWLNDAHAPLMALWQEIVARPHTLATDYATLWNEQLGQERTYFDKVRDRFNKTAAPVDFLYLLARCVKAAIRYNAEGRFNNTPDNRRKGARPDEMRQRLMRASALFQGKSRLTDWDYKKVLANCTNQDFVYMDPPYQGVCGQRDQRYLPKFAHDEFCHELHKLNKRGIQFIVSYDGRTGEKTFGELLPDTLGLIHLEVQAGRSTQSTLLGRSDVTYESLYLSSGLTKSARLHGQQRNRQLSLICVEN